MALEAATQPADDVPVTECVRADVVVRVTEAPVVADKPVAGDHE